MNRFISRIASDRFSLAAIIMIVALVGTRLAMMPFTPPGFFLDEAASGAHAVAMLHHGTNAHGVSWPLFSESLGGGYTTPIYLYPLTVWAAIFGTSELALRYFSQIATIIALCIIAFCIRLWIGKREALIAMVAGLALPWGWLQGSLAWDPALVPLFVSFALLAFSLLLYSHSQRVRTAMLFLLPLSLIALAYLYPPMRITAPLLFIGAYVMLYRRKIIEIRGIVVTCLVSAIVALPLAQFMFQPEALERSQALSVFHDASIIEGLGHAGLNLLLLLNPLFLFIAGDPNLRHSTGYEGMLGFAALVPLVALVIVAIRKPKLLDKQTRLLIWIGLFGIMTSLLGSALTNEGQPHSLRATAVWVFTLLLITVGWKVILSSWTTEYIKTVSVLIFILATTAYAIDFGVNYPKRSAGSFDTVQRQAIFDGEPTPDYPGLAIQYYKTR
jgi:4-amino-4-deoxy-L-arabinose transferase-like glycosyltransferase